MSTGQEIAQRSPQQELALRIRQDDFTEQIAMALPPSVTPGRFLRVATTAILTNDEIAKCEPHSVMRALIRCATDGLMPDGKEAAIVKRRNKKLGIEEANFMSMIYGLRKKLAEHGWTLRTDVVYENDTFEHAVVDGEEKINHTHVRPGAERGELIAAWGIVKHRDGRKLMTVLHPDDIARRRASSAYAAVWDAHTAAMWEKSAGRDLYEQVGLAEADAKNDQRTAELMAALDPGEAAATFYGTERAETPALPPASTEESQQADGAATPPPAAPLAPGPEDSAGEPQADDAAVAVAQAATNEPASPVEYATDAQRRLIFARARACSIDEAGLKAIFDAITSQTSSSKIPAAFVAEILDAIGEPPSAFVQPPLREEASA